MNQEERDIFLTGTLNSKTLAGILKLVLGRRVGVGAAETVRQGRYTYIMLIQQHTLSRPFIKLAKKTYEDRGEQKKTAPLPASSTVLKFT